ncbi:hypothetical protein [Methylobacillus sp.]|uniref:hypothetical protein n=1 Tax=Methylobacillus sp. TaxID=56818 RepID=UPI0012C8C2FA|nr:hypothetical protein [Methylobacillus sp.]MPS48540.1 hypothetical protein [Methylobacillus sp.]
MTSPAKTTTPTKARTRLTTKQKAEAISTWQAGNATLSDLAKRYGVNPRTLTRMFDKEGVKHGEKAEAAKAAAIKAAENTEIEDAVIYARRVKKAKEDRYKFAALLQSQAANVLVQAIKDKKSMASTLGDAKALEVWARFGKLSADEAYAALGIAPDDFNEENPLPELNVRVIDEEAIKKVNEANQVQEDDLPFIEDDDMGDGDLIATVGDDDKVVEGENE